LRTAPHVLGLLCVLAGTSACARGLQTCTLRVALDGEDSGERLRCRIASYDGTSAPPSIVRARANGLSIEVPVSGVPCGGSRQVVLEVSCDGYAALRSGPHVVAAGPLSCAEVDIGHLLLRRVHVRAAGLGLPAPPSSKKQDAL